jgi:hypothetical protein
LDKVTSLEATPEENEMVSLEGGEMNEEVRVFYTHETGNEVIGS